MEILLKLVVGMLTAVLVLILGRDIWKTWRRWMREGHLTHQDEDDTIWY